MISVPILSLENGRGRIHHFSLRRLVLDQERWLGSTRYSRAYCQAKALSDAHLGKFRFDQRLLANRSQKRPSGIVSIASCSGTSKGISSKIASLLQRGSLSSSGYFAYLLPNSLSANSVNLVNNSWINVLLLFSWRDDPKVDEDPTDLAEDLSSTFDLWSSIFVLCEAEPVVGFTQNWKWSGVPWSYVKLGVFSRFSVLLCIAVINLAIKMNALVGGLHILRGNELVIPRWIFASQLPPEFSQKCLRFRRRIV